MRADAFWLLSTRAVDAGILDLSVEVDPMAARAFFDGHADAGPGYVVVEGTAVIPIVGVLTKEPDFFFELMGGSASYGEIIEAVRAADADDQVERLELRVSSPGGEIAGLFEAFEVIAGVEKPTRSLVDDMAASAAYALVAATDEIVLANPLTMVGSVGVMVSKLVDGGIVRLRSTDAPKKNPDPETDAGRAAIVAELDAVHAEFAGLIARGRGVTVDQVNADYGEGALVIAADALQAGMVDGISEGISTGRVPAAQTDTRVETMADPITSLEGFRASHGALHAELLAQGVKQGIAEERDRVGALAVAGEAGGEAGAKLALTMIGDGTAYNATAQAKFAALASKQARIDDREADDTDPDGEGDGKSKPTAGVDGKASAKTPPDGEGGKGDKAGKRTAFEDDVFAMVDGKGNAAGLAAPTGEEAQL